VIWRRFSGLTWPSLSGTPAFERKPYPQSAMILEYSQVGALDVAGFD
jgi:hypothetical protein